MLVFASISLKMCLASGAPPQIPLRGLQRSPDKNIGGGGEGTTSTSAFSLGHRRINPKKVENLWVRDLEYESRF